MTNTHVLSNASCPARLPAVLDFHTLEVNFGIGRTTAYLLATSGDIQSLTLGAPGKKGKRVFLTDSVLGYIDRRLKDSTPLNCVRPAKAKAVAA